MKYKDAFFRRFNRIFFPLLYPRSQEQAEVIVNADGKTRFKVRVNSSDKLVVWENWRLKAYDVKEFPIQPADTVVDIGAHIGTFAIRAATLASRGQVYAYEASPANFKLLSENRRLNELTNLTIRNTAVAGRSGELSFYVPDGNGALGSLLPNPAGVRQTVTTTTLDEIAHEHNLAQIDFLKMDVEGAEYDILFNCSAETLRSIRFLLLEYHEFDEVRHRPQELALFLEEQGFETELQKGFTAQYFLFGTGYLKAWRHG